MSDLYEDPRLPRLAQTAEAARIADMLRDEVARRCEAQSIDAGKARAQLAREWVALARSEGQRVPGVPLRSPLKPGETLEYRQQDAAQTRIRNVWAGHPESVWALVGIEATIAAARGRQLPPAWYAAQRRLPL